MAELTTPAETTATSCCAPETQATCCEPSAKAECCNPNHGKGAATRRCDAPRRCARTGARALAVLPAAVHSS